MLNYYLTIKINNFPMLSYNFVAMKEKYLNITLKLIRNSFPLLMDKKIYVFTFRLRFYAMSVWFPPFIRFIIMSTRTAGFEENVLTGILAHELCHQERYLKLGAFRYTGFAVRFLLSRKAQAIEERATDKLTIEKGYGRQLYALSEIQYHDKKHERINEFYLSLEEIKSYSESIGKW
jgi:predicted SprT family Zn-dependent metalloprotease